MVVENRVSTYMARIGKPSPSPSVLTDRPPFWRHLHECVKGTVNGLTATAVHFNVLEKWHDEPGFFGSYMREMDAHFGKDTGKALVNTLATNLVKDDWLCIDDLPRGVTIN